MRSTYRVGTETLLLLGGQSRSEVVCNVQQAVDACVNRTGTKPRNVHVLTDSAEIQGKPLHQCDRNFWAYFFWNFERVIHELPQPP